MDKLTTVILSGGSGTRLWPVSRRAYPKPFMRMSDGQTLAEKTLNRALSLGGDNILTVTGRDYYFITRDEYLRVDERHANRYKYLLEPMGRNTAPAIAMAALYIKHLSGPDEKMLVLPADHVIRDEDSFRQAVTSACALADDQYLVTFGITPTHAETGYGYIRAGNSLDHNGQSISEFVEKPDLATAKDYIADGDYYWNSGMFCFTAGRFLDALAKHAPDVLTCAENCWATMQADEEVDKEIQPRELPADMFARMPDISVDYAVMEHAENAAVVPGDFGWSDVGSWKAMSEINDADASGNHVTGKAVTVDTENCYLQGEQRLIATVGVQNLVIVDTGDAVLVADRERAQDVKAVVEQLRDANDEKATFHQTVHRPWGSYTILEDADDCKVKRLIVKPGQVLSLQKHFRRSEHWTVVTGTAKVRVGDREFLLHRNESAYIPMGALHRLENTTDTDIALIEVQCGDYFGEDDIVRLEDVYGRT